MPSPTTCHRYAVRLSRRAEFPLDMLRRDRAEPASAKDRALIRLLNERQNDDALRALPSEVIVALIGAEAPNIARWESFGCAVLDSDGEPFVTPGAPSRPAARQTGEEARIREAAGEILATLEALVIATTPLRHRSGAACPGFEAAHSSADTLIARLRGGRSGSTDTSAPLPQ